MGGASSVVEARKIEDEKAEQELKDEDGVWHIQRDNGWAAVAEDIGTLFTNADKQKNVPFVVGNSQYTAIQISGICAWQRNIVTNQVRPLIFCKSENCDTKSVEILNQRIARNPSAASKSSQKN